MRLVIVHKLFGKILGLPVLAALATGHAEMAKAERSQLMLAPHLNFSIVCLENPATDGWIDLSHKFEPIASARYGLFVKLSEKPNGRLPFSKEPYEYRLTVDAFPCFYEYTGHRFTGYGIYQNMSEYDRTHLLIDGMSLPRIQDEVSTQPIIEAMIKQCRGQHFSWPFTFSSIRYCEREISDILISQTTSIAIYYDPASPDAFERIIFVHGFPYLRGQPLYR